MQLGGFLKTSTLIAALGLAALSQTPPPKETPGLAPRAAATDYYAHSQAGAVTVAAEFLGHSIPTPQGILNSEEYVAVETAVFGAPNAHATIALSDYSLRINGKKAQPAQPFEAVAYSIKDPEWAPPISPDKPKTSLNSGSGGGGGGILGGGGDDKPTPPRMPPGEVVKMQQRVRKMLLPEGNRPTPQAGLIFFRYGGGAKGVYEVELVYKGAAGKTTLDLHP